MEEWGRNVTFLCPSSICSCGVLSSMQENSNDNDFLNDVRYVRSQRVKRSKFDFLSLVGGKSEDYEIYEDDYLEFLHRGLFENGEAFNAKELIGDQFVKSAEKVENGDLRLLQSPFDESDAILQIDEGLNEEFRNEDSDDDDDPQYKFFLSHLKGYGKSFTFEIKEANGLSKIIEYQKEEPIYDRRVRKRNRNMNNTLEMERKRKRTRTEPQLVEEDYQRFLNTFKTVNGGMNLPIGSNKKLVYDGVVCLDNVSCREDTNLRTRYSEINNVEDDIIYHMPEGGETSALKEKFMAILRKPFNEQEYKKLWHDVTKRVYISRYKELQDGNEKSVTTRHKGKSYLKRYKAVRRELEAV